MRRWPLIALVLVAALALSAATASAGQSSKVYTLVAQSVVHVSGSDLYCAVTSEQGAPAVTCMRGLPKNGMPRGALALANDHVAIVDHVVNGKIQTVFTRHEPSFSHIAVFGGGRHYTLLDLRVGDVAAIHGTHMALVVTTAKSGGAGIGVLDFDGQNHLIKDSYGVGISDHYVTLLKVLSQSKFKTLYRHGVK